MKSKLTVGARNMQTLAATTAFQPVGGHSAAASSATADAPWRLFDIAPHTFLHFGQNEMK
jgi:hypothetical protein